MQALYQDLRFDSVATADGLLPAFSSRGETYSALLSYQANWQTRYFIGIRRTTIGDSVQDPSDTEVFAKFSYVLSKWK